MSLPRYESYRNSGIDWLGALPAHWSFAPIKAVATCNDEVLDEATSPDFEIEYAEISDVEANRGLVGSTTVAFGVAPSRARRIVREGDILVSTVRTYLRAIAQVQNPPTNLIASTGFAVIRPNAVHSGFLGYACQAEFLISQVIARSVGVSYPSINASELTRLPVPLPPSPEQFAITSFLDGETAKIDALIAEQQRLIELLKQKRQAVISRAVTKGVSPDVPMKDSGIEWLGDVPVHWDIKPLKYISSLKGRLGWQGLRADDYTEVGPFLVTSEHFTGDRIDWHHCYHVSVERYDMAPEIQLRAADLLMMKDGAAMGKLAYVDEVPGPACLNSHLLLFRPLKGLYHSRFLYFVLGGNGFKTYMFQKRTGTTFFGISQQNIGCFLCPLPPIREQIQIIETLRRKTEEIDSLMAEARAAIGLLGERRTALISAAVTGKIDVRSLAQPAPERGAAA